MSKWRVAALVIAFGWTCALPGIASAHILKIDGDIGAELHIQPDDNPSAGQEIDYTISFDDATGRFSLEGCDCTVSFVTKGKTINTKALTVSGKTTSENRYTFTLPGAYILRVTGKPKTPKDFQPFTLDYPLRVSGGQAGMQTMPPALWLGLGMMIGLVMLAAFATNRTSE